MFTTLTHRATTIIIGLVLLLVLSAATAASVHQQHRNPTPAPADHNPTYRGGGRTMIR